MTRPHLSHLPAIRPESHHKFLLHQIHFAGSRHPEGNSARHKTRTASRDRPPVRPSHPPIHPPIRPSHRRAARRPRPPTAPTNRTPTRRRHVDRGTPRCDRDA
jgi:hypothetical protein